MILKPIYRWLPKYKEEISDKQSETETVKEIQPLKAKFSDIIELNIIFTDNYETPLFKKSNYSLSNAEEQIVISNAISSIQQCAEFTRESPPVKEGYYKDKKIESIMENVIEDDIRMFLGYVKAKPKKYVGKTWRISETFATWLLNNSPMGEVDR